MNAKSSKKPELTEHAKKFARSWPKKLTTILHVLDHADIRIKPVIEPECGFQVVEKWDGELDSHDICCELEFLPTVFTAAHVETMYMLDLCYDSCVEYIAKLEAQRTAAARRNRVLRELTDEQLEALGLSRP